MGEDLETAVRALPSGFVETYYLVFERGLAVTSSGPRESVGKASASRVTRLSTSQTETRGGSKGSRKSGGSRVPIRSFGAVAFRAKIDRKLRAINREMRAYLREDSIERPRRCTVCKAYGEPSWLYCPRDGKPMEEI